jgi:NADPH:quinone reductase-like Zn-dependent oxidoreductase
MGTMQAVRIHEYGGQGVLKLEQAPVPVIGDEDVLIRVHATSVNPVEWKIRAGYLQGWLNYTLPWILGVDISGTVAETGANVTQFAIGDEVIANADLMHSGSYAEFTAVNQARVVRKPASLNHIEAATVPHAALTAWSALVSTAQVAPGQTVLIHGAAGGVGVYAVQLAKCRGARVIATASPKNHEFLRGLGADEVIDYNTVRFEDVLQPVDIVFDTIGGETLQRSYALVKPGGQIVSVVGAPDQDVAASLGIHASQVSAKMDQAILGEISRLIDTNQIQVVVSSVFPLSEIQQAHALSEGMHVRGKIGIKIVD